jgi:hypothetical protein
MGYVEGYAGADCRWLSGLAARAGGLPGDPKRCRISRMVPGRRVKTETKERFAEAVLIQVNAAG